MAAPACDAEMVENTLQTDQLSESDPLKTVETESRKEDSTPLADSDGCGSKINWKHPGVVGGIFIQVPYILCIVNCVIGRWPS